MNQVRKTLLMSLALLVFGAGVLAWAYFGLHEENRAAEEQKEVAAKAFPWSKDEVRALVLNPLGAKVELERRGEGWALVEPVKAVADQKAVNSLLDALLSLRSEELVATNLDEVESHGLDFPRYSARLINQKGSERLLKVGEENPFNQSLPYIIADDARIHSTRQNLGEALDKKAFDLRSKALLEFRNADVVALEFWDSKGSWKGLKEGKDWKLEILPGGGELAGNIEAAQDEHREALISDWADESAISKLITALRQARATDFPTEEHDDVALRAFGLDKPQLRVAISLVPEAEEQGLDSPSTQRDGSDPQSDSGSRAVFDFALDEGRLYARRVGQGPIMELKTELLENLSKDPDELRDLRLARFSKDDIRRLEFVFGAEEPVVVNRRKEKKEDLSWESEVFTFEGREEQPKRWRLSSTIHTLSILKAEAVVEENPAYLSRYGLDNPRFSYTLFGDNGELLAKVLLGHKSGDSRYFALNVVDNRVLEVDQLIADELPQGLDDLLERKKAAFGEP